MGALSKSKAVAALWAVCAGTSVSAQTAPAILECKWESGVIIHTRIGQGLWEEWNGYEYKWQPKVCFLNGYAGECKVETSELLYSWNMQLLKYIDTPKGTWVATVSGGASMSIDRVKGIASFQESSRTDYSNRSPVTRNTSATGTCQRGTDPALQPKPEPPAPKI